MENTTASAVIELTVNNHPGVMSHITGLFSRRGYNLEGILCGPMEDRTKSRMYLLVVHEEQLEQIVKQIEKLYDICSVAVREDIDHSIFNRIHELVR